ncbi:MAG: DUF998 domain-containing protein [Patescibacteria group bacterium]|jgi:hypothetical protein
MKKISIFGFLGTATYLLTIIIGGLFRDNYRLFIDPISRIFARGLPGSWAIALFLTLGNFLIIAIAIGIFIRSKNTFIKTGMIFLIFSGIIASILYNFFPMDPWLGGRTPADVIHNDIFGVVVASIIFALFFFALGAKFELRYKSLSKYLWATFIAFLAVSVAGGISWDNFPYLTGSLESIFLLIFMQWLIVISRTLQLEHNKNN